MNKKLHPDPEYPHRVNADSRMTAEESQDAWDTEASGMAEEPQVRLHLPLYGAQSFAELENVSVEDIEEKRRARLRIYFMLILGNIVSNPDIDVEEVGLRLHSAVAEYGRKLNGIADGTPPRNAEDENRIIPKESKVKSPIKRESGIDRPARDYAYVPDPNLPATWRLPLTDVPGQVSLTRLGLAAAAISPGGHHGVKVKIPASALSAVKRRILGEYRMLKVPEGKIPVTVKEATGSQFSIWKEKGSERYRWMCVYSNNFIDRDNPPEIISEKSHKTFVQMVDEGVVDYPELWHWHIPGTAWGKADMLDYVDGFALAVGYVYPGHEKEAEALAGRKDLGVSHGMPFATLLYDPENPGVIDFHVTREISVLPHHAVANPLTDFVVLEHSGGVEMAITPNKREWLLNEIGLDEDFVKSLERNIKELGAMAHDIGLASKEADEDADEEYEDEEDSDEEYEDEDSDEEDVDGDEDVENDEDESEEKARSSRRPRARDKPSSFAARRGKKGYLWTGDAREEKGRPQSGSSGAKRDKPSSFAAGGGKGRPQSGSSGAKRDKPSSFAARGKKKPSSFARRGKKKPSSFADMRKEIEGDESEIQYVTREEVADAISGVMLPIMDSIKEINEMVGQLGSLVKELSESDEKRIAAVKEQTPTASLRDLIQRSIVIGRDEARIDGRTQLAKEGPQERKQESLGSTPSSFLNGLMSTAIHGTAQDAQ